jgi:predicted Zn-dependent protease
LVYQRHFEEAVKWLVTALKLRPKKSTLIFNASNMSAIMSQKGYVLGTQPLLETLVQLEPKNVTNWFNLALVYQATNNTNEAIRCFREVEIINPTDEIALLSLANLYAKNGKIKDGLTYCDKALAISADSEKALLLKAQLLAYDGEYIRAIRLLDDALHKYPKRDTFWYILATIHERQGNRNEALRASLNCKDILVRLKANPENLSMVNEMIQRLQVR